MIIDTHAHIIVPEITLDAAPDEAWRPQIIWEDGQQIVAFGGKWIKSATDDFVNIEKILAAQEEAGVDMVLLCPWVNLLFYNTYVDEGLRRSRIQNKALSELAQKYSDRVAGLGTVPLQNPEMAANELKALMELPGVYGVEVAASVNSVSLGDDRFLPFWNAAEDSGALVFIHPTTRGFKEEVFNRYYLWNSIGNPLETTITAADMVMSGLMETHPKLKVLVAQF